MEENKVKLWDRIQRGMEAGFDAGMSAVHTITELPRTKPAWSI